MKETPDRITIRIAEANGAGRACEPVRTGVPLPRTWLRDAARARLLDAQGSIVAAQFEPLAFWGDGSIKWLLVDAIADVAADHRGQLYLHRDVTESAPPARLETQEQPGGFRVDTGVAVFEIAREGTAVLSRATVGGDSLIVDGGIRVRAVGRAGNSAAAVFNRTWTEQRGALRLSLVSEGEVACDGHILRIKVRRIFCAGSAGVRIECEAWNPRAARHPGGLWDLGDAGSVMLRDLSVELIPAAPVQGLGWQIDDKPWQLQPPDAWSIYQDSSGGERWNSPNHLGHDGKLTVDFRGFRVHGSAGAVLAQGDRATPAVALQMAEGWVAASVNKFWQNFPKALRWQQQVLSIGLFPRECAAGFELQGGEKKRHTLMLKFGTGQVSAAFHELHAPLQVSLEPREVAASGAVGPMVAEADDPHHDYREYVGSILQGPHSFAAKRDLIDEYGWRNFGDLYADHEAVNHRGPEPFISHYNNQYDFVYGAGLHFLRSADPRWRELMVDAAAHLIDIDIYHTTEDKSAFNGGLFWHTDHYQPAATSTHRTYSARNRSGGAYGGGPSNEHNYTSGLLHYYYLTGDNEARAAVIELADWVLRMDDGALTLFALFDSGPTGAATGTVDLSYQKAGRGAGNSINALLDAYALTSRRHYLSKAEEFVQRCIHPADDIAALGLLEPEYRWSYLVFLQVLGKYLEKKHDLGEFDYQFHYARESLLHYAEWMSRNEVPYKDVLDKVELPTETWPAQDIRKCHVLGLAARHAPAAMRPALQSRAGFFFSRCLSDLLTFPTAHLTRPQVLLGVYACQYAGLEAGGLPEVEPHHHAFGEPEVFVPQRLRLKSAVRQRMRVTWRELSRIVADRFHRWRGRS